MTITSHFKATIQQLGPDVDGYVLDEVDGEKPRHPRCVLSKTGAGRAIGLRSEGGSALWRTLSRKNIRSEIDEKVREKIDNPIVFKHFNTGSESRPGVTVHGLDTSTFIEILRAILKAKLTKTQRHLGERAQTMLIALANTTLDSIVYQESGYWKTIEGQRVAEILDNYLQEHARKWAKTFPDDFWVKLIRVKGYPSYVALKRPAFVGHWVNDIVWDRLVPGARKKLNELNPRLPAGYRKNKHHQHTTEDYGLPELKAHLIKVMAYMDAAANDTQFMRMLNRGTPKFGNTYEMALEDVYH